MKKITWIRAWVNRRLLRTSRKDREAGSRFLGGVRSTTVAFITCLSALATNASVAGGAEIATAFAQLGGGYAAHYGANRLGNWLLDQSDDFPSPSLSSLSVVATSLVISVATSSAVYGTGRIFDDDPRSLGWTLLGGVSAVGGASLAGVLVGLDDWKSGAAVGSVIGRYLVPVTAVAFYYWRDGGKKGSGQRSGKLVVPLVSIRF